MKDVLRLLAGALANFAAISFGIAVYEGDPLGFVLGGYSLFIAAVLAWRAQNEYMDYGVHRRHSDRCYRPNLKLQDQLDFPAPPRRGFLFSLFTFQRAALALPRLFCCSRPARR